MMDRNVAIVLGKMLAQSDAQDETMAYGLKEVKDRVEAWADVNGINLDPAKIDMIKAYRDVTGPLIVERVRGCSDRQLFDMLPRLNEYSVNAWELRDFMAAQAERFAGAFASLLRQTS